MKLKTSTVNCTSRDVHSQEKVCKIGLKEILRNIFVPEFIKFLQKNNKSQYLPVEDNNGNSWKID